jgi:hypothetical protein
MHNRIGVCVGAVGTAARAIPSAGAARQGEHRYCGGDKQRSPALTHDPVWSFHAFSSA